MDRRYDVAVIGAGIVGLATARAILERAPDRRLVILEKEPGVGLHQTGRNSGVVHSGIYYRPGSLKARLCRDGGAKLEAFCEERGVPFVRRGKLIVATDSAERDALEELERRGAANGVSGIERLGAEGIRRAEPRATGVGALYLPDVAVVDFAVVARAIAEDLRERGADVQLDAEIVAGRREGHFRHLETASGDVWARLVVNCAGLHADRVARMLGARPPVRILPFRGEYWSLRPESAGLVRGLVYPVPDPRFPFLGVHLTRDVNDEVHAGPNAVLALSREGYLGARPRLRDALETLAYPGFVALAREHWRSGLEELRRSRSKRAFAAAARRLVPDLEVRDLVSRTSGVRAQAVAPDGRLLDDFATLWGHGVLHVLNAPSPAATASLAIGEWIAGGLARAGALGA